jgi:metal-sulfur cluster biosynthetic enzyme
MTTAPTTDGLRDALRAVADPASGKDIVSAGLVEGIELRGSLVQVALLTDRAHAAAMEPVRREVEALLGRQPGISNATAVLTAHKALPQPAAQGHGQKAALLLPDCWTRISTVPACRACWACRASHRYGATR